MEPFLFAFQDWSLVICEGCGLEQGSVEGPCPFCGCETCTYSPRSDVVRETFRAELGPP